MSNNGALAAFLAKRRGGVTPAPTSQNPAGAFLANSDAVVPFSQNPAGAADPQERQIPSPQNPTYAGAAEPQRAQNNWTGGNSNNWESKYAYTGGGGRSSDPSQHQKNYGEDPTQERPYAAPAPSQELPPRSYAAPAPTDAGAGVVPPLAAFLAKQRLNASAQRQQAENLGGPTQERPYAAPVPTQELPPRSYAAPTPTDAGTGVPQQAQNNWTGGNSNNWESKYHAYNGEKQDNAGWGGRSSDPSSHQKNYGEEKKAWGSYGESKYGRIMLNLSEVLNNIPSYIPSSLELTERSLLLRTSL